MLSTFTNELLFPIPTFESAPFGNFVTGNETETAPSWEFQWRNFTEHAQNFWKILAPLCISVIGILTPLMMQYLLYCKLRRRWHRKEAAENELSQLRQWVQDLETFMLELREELVCMQKTERERRRRLRSEICSVKKMVMAEDEQCAQLWNEMSSLQKVMILRDECYADRQNKMKSLKMMVKEEEKCHAELQNEMCSLQMMMLKAEDIRRAHSQSELDSMKKAMKGSSLMTAEQTSGDPASMVSPVKIGTCKKNDILAGKKEEKEPISEAWVSLAPPTDLKAMEMDSMKRAMRGMMTVEQTSGDPASMVAPVKIGTCKKNDILACKTAGEKEEKEPISEVRVTLSPPPDLKAVRPSVGSGSNTRHKPGQGHVKLCNQKLDFSKTRARVDTWRKK
jgi:hypothetical protein